MGGDLELEADAAAGPRRRRGVGTRRRLRGPVMVGAAFAPVAAVSFVVGQDGSRGLGVVCGRDGGAAAGVEELGGLWRGWLGLGGFLVAEAIGILRKEIEAIIFRGAADYVDSSGIV
jgi:hypothetical protein